MRYLRNPELKRQLLFSLAFWAAAVCLALLFLSGGVVCAVFLGAAGLVQLLFWTAFTVRRYRRLAELAAEAEQLLPGARFVALQQ